MHFAYLYTLGFLIFMLQCLFISFFFLVGRNPGATSTSGRPGCGWAASGHDYTGLSDSSFGTMCCRVRFMVPPWKASILPNNYTMGCVRCGNFNSFVALLHWRFQTARIALYYYYCSSLLIDNFFYNCLTCALPTTFHEQCVAITFRLPAIYHCSFLPPPFWSFSI